MHDPLLSTIGIKITDFATYRLGIPTVIYRVVRVQHSGARNTANVHLSRLAQGSKTTNQIVLRRTSLGPEETK